MKKQSAVWGIAAGLVLLGLAVALWLVVTRPFPPMDPGPQQPEAPQVVGERAAFARLQDDLGRVAAGHGIRPPEAVADRLELLADALQALLAGHAARAGTLLDAVEAEVAARLPAEAQIAADPAAAERAEWLVGYFELLPAPPKPGSLKLDTATFVRFVLVLRKAEAVLLAGMLPRLAGYDLVARKAASDQDPALSGLWLKLPCRLAASRRPALEATAKRLKQLAGPLTDCPLPEGKEHDFALAEKMAKAVAGR